MTDQEIHVTVWNDARQNTPRAVLVHGTMSWGEECFAAQRPLADEFRLDLMDRRGFGASADTECSDYDVDADDILELMGDGVHLVGHSFGAVATMVAASRRPERVRSLTLIEPSPLRTAEEHPVVAAALERIEMSFGTERPEMSPEEYLRASTEPYGMPVPEATPKVLRGVRSAMRERPAWDARLPLEPLAAAPWPKYVINGTWETAHPSYREFVGEALMACGDHIADRIGAEKVRVGGTDHYPHRDAAAMVNDLLRKVWRS
ncbi:alpha/beta fold hydrolase [Streptomyces sioyaensis]|uniref:alpha/beta fold hydrolase n=1 Tax=Streptomyces sioyaensis TaxID=67364 RepID=UPI0037BAA054